MQSSAWQGMEQMKSIEIYELVLSGKLKRFPKDFFSCQGIVNIENVCIPIIQYLIEEKLKWNNRDICNKLTRKIFRKYKLGGMLTHIFNDSPYAAINTAYPDRFKEWELARYSTKLLDNRNRY